VVNRLDLNAAELDAIRELQAGMAQPERHDPIWDMLAMVDLVDLASGAPTLTLLDRLYKTD
jgi:hypothetical protein